MSYSITNTEKSFYKLQNPNVVKGNVENVKALRKLLHGKKALWIYKKNILEVINEFGRIAACKINLSFLFLHTSNEQ